MIKNFSYVFNNKQQRNSLMSDTDSEEEYYEEDVCYEDKEIEELYKCIHEYIKREGYSILRNETLQDFIEFNTDKIIYVSNGMPSDMYKRRNKVEIQSIYDKFIDNCSYDEYANYVFNISRSHNRSWVRSNYYYKD